MLTAATEDMERIEIERIHRDKREAIQIFEGMDGKEKKVTTSAVRITVTGTDGSVISDVWTRERFWSFFRQASQVIADD